MKQLDIFSRATYPSPLSELQLHSAVARGSTPCSNPIQNAKIPCGRREPETPLICQTHADLEGHGEEESLLASLNR